MSSGHSGHWFKRSLRGLFAGKTRLTGNHVSPSKAHVKRAWLPNVQRKNLWSDILQRYISINVTTHALKEIDRFGGVDNYLRFTPPHKVKSVAGENLRRILEGQLDHEARHARWVAAGGVASSPEVKDAPASPTVNAELR